MGKSRKKKVILIVDPQKFNRSFLGEILSSGYMIETTSDGFEAVRYLKRGEQPAVVLISIAVSQEEEEALYQELFREDQKSNIPVLLILTDVEEDEKWEKWREKITDVVNKPFEPGMIRNRVCNAIELYEARKHIQQLLDKGSGSYKKQWKEPQVMADMLGSESEFGRGESGDHVRRIRQLTRMIVERLREKEAYPGLTDEEIEIISNASVIHDMGKISIPDYLLRRQDRLTTEEFEEIKKYTMYGCSIIPGLSFEKEEELFRYCYEICRHYFDCWGTREYPESLKKEEIHMGTQVAAIADIYDALVSDSTGKRTCGHKKALRMIKRGDYGAFDPKILECFFEIADEAHEKYYDSVAPVHLKKRMRLHSKYLKVNFRKIQEEKISDKMLRFLEREHQKYTWLSELSDEIIFDYDRITDTLEFSEKYREIFGGNPEIHNAMEFIMNSPLIAAEENNKIRERLNGLAPDNPGTAMEIQLMTKEKKEWFELVIRGIWNGDTCSGYFGKISSIERLKEETIKWQKKAMHDYLTGLYNRQALESALDEMVNEKKQVFSLLFLDVDNFKTVNDTMGHHTGDALLKEIANLLTSKFRETDLVARLGGDEFCALLKGLTDREILERKANEICQVVAGELAEDFGVNISCSIGFSSYPLDGEESYILLEKADQALYEAKKNGKSGYVFYHEALEEEPYLSMISSIDEVPDSKK